MRRLLFVVLSALLLSVLPGVPAQAAAPGATFNVPNPWGTTAQKYRIVNKVVAAIKGTRPTAADPAPTILITSYLFDRSNVVDALIAACRRDVSVRVILDGKISNRNERRVVAQLTGDQWADRDGDGDLERPRTGKCGQGEPDPTWPKPELSLRDTSPLAEDELGEAALSADEAEGVLETDVPEDADWGPDRSYVTACQGSCRGGPGNMHTKFYAFSSTGSASDVIMVSSSNLNRGGAVSGWNDMYTMTGRPAGFTYYEKVHREMTADEDLPTASVAANTLEDGPFTSRFFPLDNAGKSKDPVLQDLNKIRCRSAFGRTKINVSMFWWKGTRGEYLANKLLSLARNGCRVSIVYGAPSVAIATKLRKAAKARRIQLFDSRWDFNRDGYNEIRTHAKYVAVKGTYVGSYNSPDRAAHVVMTGSQNWVGGSLRRGDESSLNIELAGAYNQYLSNWHQIRKHSRKLPYRR